MGNDDIDRVLHGHFTRFVIIDTAATDLTGHDIDVLDK